MKYITPSSCHHQVLSGVGKTGFIAEVTIDDIMDSWGISQEERVTPWAVQAANTIAKGLVKDDLGHYEGHYLVRQCMMISIQDVCSNDRGVWRVGASLTPLGEKCLAFLDHGFVVDMDRVCADMQRTEWHYRDLMNRNLDGALKKMCALHHPDLKSLVNEAMMRKLLS